jgi:CBS domain-containing protein
MASTIQDVMTREPCTLEESTTLREAGQEMQRRDIGDVIVVRSGKVCGVVTDRDIVVRAVAEGRDPNSTRLSDVMSEQLATIQPSTPIDDAVRVMREKAVRRLPVVEGDRPVGIVSIGDLAMERDPSSALADISAAEPNA